MNFNIVDIIIGVFILVMGITGAKRGVFKELVLCCGTILVFIIAYIFKDLLGNIFLRYFPMFDFPNFFKGIVTLNILVYQVIAFIIVLALLLILFEAILHFTGIFEKILKFTIILGIPSKIFGFLVGLIEGYVLSFVILFLLTQPAFNFKIFRSSKYGNYILTSSPILTNITKDSVDIVEDIYSLKNIDNPDEVNTRILEMMLEKKVVGYDIVNELYQKDKLNFNGIETILAKYKHS